MHTDNPVCNGFEYVRPGMSPTGVELSSGMSPASNTAPYNNENVSRDAQDSGEYQPDCNARRMARQPGVIIWGVISFPNRAPSVLNHSPHTARQRDSTRRRVALHITPF